MSVLTPHLKAIYDLIATNNALEVVAPTGTGKSVLLPATVARAGNRVLVSVPTRTSAISLANAVQNQLLPELRVGYAAEGTITYDDRSDLIYATSGHVRRLMLSHFTGGVARPWTGPPILFLDEVHSGSVDNSIIMSLWSEATAQKVPFPRLVLITATPVMTELRYQPRNYTVEVPQFTVQVEYTRDYRESEVYDAMIRRVVQLHSTAAINDHILLFAAGTGDVTTIVDRLTSAKLAGAKVMGVYGSMTSAESSKIYEQAPPETRKIIVATNVAESSITVSDLTYVLDSMLEKRAGTSSSGGESLTTHYISKKSADQRKGRTGRTRNGKCIRYISEAHYEELESERPPEIQLVPIYNEMTELYGAGLDPSRILTGVEPSKVEAARALLLQCGLLQQVESPTGEIKLQVTQLGDFASRLRLGVRLAAFLWHWVVASYPIFPGIVIASLINSEPHNFFTRPPRDRNLNHSDYEKLVHEHRERYYKEFTGTTQLATCLKLWDSLTKETGGRFLGTTYDTYDRELSDWCNQHSISFRPIKELLGVVTSTMSYFTRNGMDVQVSTFDAEQFGMASIPLLYNYYADRLMTNQGRGRLIDSRGTTYNVEQRGVPSMGLDNVQYVIALLTIEISDSRHTSHIASLVVPINVEGQGTTQ